MVDWPLCLRWRRSPTLAEGLASRRDNFLLLRLIAAAMVIYGHASAIASHGPRDLIAQMRLGYFAGSIAVDMFFVISGFLVTASYAQRPQPLRFVRARAFRIVPAYAACIVLSAFVFGAIYTTLPLRDYLAHPETTSYVLNNIRFQFGANLQWNLPGVFADNPKLTAVNGSLWTLPAEVRMYLWVFAIGILGLLSRRWTANLALLALAVVAITAPSWLPGFEVVGWLRLGGMFALGAACYVNREYIPASGWLALGLLLLAVALHSSPLFHFVFALGLACFVFWFAYRLPWHGYNRFGDYSYGTYLWGFPLQQVIAHHAPGLDTVTHTLIVVPIAIAFGFASWTVIEAPMIAIGRGGLKALRGAAFPPEAG